MGGRFGTGRSTAALSSVWWNHSKPSNGFVEHGEKFDGSVARTVRLTGSMRKFLSAGAVATVGQNGHYGVSDAARCRVAVECDPEAKFADSRGDRGLVAAEPGDADQRHAAAQRGHRGAVAAMADHELDSRDDGTVSDVVEHGGVARDAQWRGAEGAAGSREAVEGQAGKSVECR